MANEDHDSQPSGLSSLDSVHVKARAIYYKDRQDQLSAPMKTVNASAERILENPGQPLESRFAADMRLIRNCGDDLLGRINEAMSRAARGKLTDEKELATLRHDWRNRLNWIINYSEMWIEEFEDDESFVHDTFIPDLKLIYENGRRCLSVMDTILSDRQGVSDSERQQINRVKELLNQAREPEKARETGHILVVDDNPANLDLVRRLLEDVGHTVSTVDNGPEALRRLDDDQTIDLVLLDVLMPGMDGCTVLTKIRENDALRHIPVIIVSGLQQSEIIVRCIKIGAEDYLEKPVNKTMLYARLDSCLVQRRFYEREKQYLARIEQERERADRLLHVILPEAVVTELKETGCVTPRRYENVAVLFADIVNFTRYCDDNAADDVVEYLQELVVRWEGIARQHNVQKIKTIGDCFMAASGLLEPVPCPVENCIRCGLQMIDATRDLEIGWDLRVGVHVGPVVAGVLGRQQYLFDLWGDTVNMASRMESNGQGGLITLSAAGHAALEGIADCLSVGSVEVKGKGRQEIFHFERFAE